MGLSTTGVYATQDINRHPSHHAINMRGYAHQLSLRANRMKGRALRHLNGLDFLYARCLALKAVQPTPNTVQYYGKVLLKVVQRIL